MLIRLEFIAHFTYFNQALTFAGLVGWYKML